MKICNGCQHLRNQEDSYGGRQLFWCCEDIQITAKIDSTLVLIFPKNKCSNQRDQRV